MKYKKTDLVKVSTSDMNSEAEINQGGKRIKLSFLQ